VRGGRREEMSFEPADPFPTELAHFSTSVLRDIAPEPSGIEGLTTSASSKRSTVPRATAVR